MNKLVFLIIIMAFIFCLPFVFQVQADSMDKLKMQQQLDQFKSQLQTNVQNTNTMAQEVIQEKQVEAAQHQERQEATSDVFDKMAKKSQESSFNHMTRAYGLPLLIIAVVGIILLAVWHQNI